MLIELFQILYREWPAFENKRHSIVCPMATQTLGLDVWLCEDLAYFYPVAEHDFEDNTKLIENIKSPRDVGYSKTAKIGKTVTMLMNLFEAINKVWPEPEDRWHTVSFCTEAECLMVGIWPNKHYQFHFVVEEKDMNDASTLVDNMHGLLHPVIKGV